MLRNRDPTTHARRPRAGLGDATRGAQWIYAAPSVSRWLPPSGSDPAMRRPDRASRRWRAEGPTARPAQGARRCGARVRSALLGGLSLQFGRPGRSGTRRLSMRWALAPSAVEGTGTPPKPGMLVRWAMHEHDVLDVFAILQPDNTRAAATAQRIGMEWVTEVGHLPQGRYQVYRIRHSDLDYED